MSLLLKKKKEGKAVYRYLASALTSRNKAPNTEGPVATDDLEVSNYYVKDALDANFTFVPAESEPNQKVAGDEGGTGDRDIDEPDIGEG